MFFLSEWHENINVMVIQMINLVDSIFINTKHPLLFYASLFLLGSLGILIAFVDLPFLVSSTRLLLTIHPFYVNGKILWQARTNVCLLLLGLGSDTQPKFPIPITIKMTTIK
jgi:hypothetical protein